MSEAFAIPITKRQADYEAKLRRIERFLDGKVDGKDFRDTPEQHPENPSVNVPIEVGEKVDPYVRRQARGPGIHLLTPDDQGFERNGSWTVMTPTYGKRPR